MRRFVPIVAQVFLCIAILAAAPSAFAQQEPDAVVGEIYTSYEDNGLGVSPTDPALRDRFSARLQALLAEEDDRIDRDGIGNLDFDVFVDAQDFDITGIEIGTPEISGDKAEVAVGLLNFGQPRKFRYLLVMEDGAWRIDDIVAVSDDMPWTLSVLLAGN
ncbi:YbjP/YqhG family protein [Microbaculum marinisediminis]|uniref:YbjP/YqhG family protein n=1 Tax=Microbaculum marinisediminis TaxID=2931392 RepID=A0AAW5R1W2_9HYPH|nr:YbjP/YqhG family protein [Microbaculum sp. A6E488]MCT8972589.1 YbjP/YqhG family protein [Microbaculum sp. A6E488]